MPGAKTMKELLDHKKILVEMFSLPFEAATRKLISDRYTRPFDWGNYADILQEVSTLSLTCKDKQARQEATGLAWAAAAARAMAMYDITKNGTYLEKATRALEAANRCLQSSTQKPQSNSAQEVTIPPPSTPPTD